MRNTALHSKHCQVPAIELGLGFVPFVCWEMGYKGSAMQLACSNLCKCQAFISYLPPLNAVEATKITQLIKLGQSVHFLGL